MMRKSKRLTGDILWTLVLLLCVAILLVPQSREVFLYATDSHPYLCGFFKFFILATMGDLLGVRILNGQWSFPQGFFLKAGLWGMLGMAITLAMTVYNEGVSGAMEVGRLPFENRSIALAFFSSAVMNLTFGPMLYIYHKFGELLIDAKCEKRGRRVALSAFVEKVDWQTMVCFSWLKTCTLIWIPLHTIVFLLPPQYRVVVSAFLSLLLGILIALSKKNRCAEVRTPA